MFIARATMREVRPLGLLALHNGYPPVSVPHGSQGFCLVKLRLVSE